MSNYIHKNDFGTEFRIEVLDHNGATLDISNQTALSVIFKKPGGTTLTKTASLVTDGTDGLIKYVTIADDLDEIGTWKIQAKIESINGTWKTSFKSFKVYRNLS